MNDGDITRFTIPPNVCGDRVRTARAMRNWSLEELAIQCNLHGVHMTKNILSRIECKTRQVVDGELVLLADVLDVNILWLLELSNDFTPM